MSVIASIDGPSRLIYLHADTVNESIHPLEIYQAVREFRRNDEELQKYDNFMRGDGYISKGGGKFTERYFTLLDGTRIVPYDVTHVLTITGTLLTDDGQEGVFAFNRTPLSVGVYVDIQYIPPQVEVITVQAGSGLSDTQNTLLEEVHLSVEKMVHIDTNNITSGDGSPSNPFNSFDLAISYATLRGIRKLHLHSDCALDVDVVDFEILGLNQPLVNLNNKNVTDSTITNCAITGVSTGAGVYRECNIHDGTSGINGIYHECALSGDVIADNNAYVILSSCFSGIAGSGRPSITAVGTVSLALRHWSGGISIENIVDGCAVTVGMDSGECRFEASCTGGDIHVRGVGYYENLGTATVEDRALIVNCDSINGVTPQEVWEYGTRELTSGGFSGTVDANVISVTGTAVNDVDDFKAQNVVVDEVAIADEVQGRLLAANVKHVNDVAVTSVDDFKADAIDLSGIPAEVWSYVSRELTAAAGLTAEQEAKVDQALIDISQVPTRVWNYTI